MPDCAICRLQVPYINAEPLSCVRLGSAPETAATILGVLTDVGVLFANVSHRTGMATVQNTPAKKSMCLSQPQGNAWQLLSLCKCVTRRLATWTYVARGPPPPPACQLPLTSVR